MRWRGLLFAESEARSGSAEARCSKKRARRWKSGSGRTGTRSLNRCGALRMKNEKAAKKIKMKNQSDSCVGCGCCSNSWPSQTKLRMAKIAKVREEFAGNRTFYMDEKMGFEPGQFAMVWLPDFDEKPIALIPWGEKYALNIEGKGIATKKMLELRAGE